MSSATTPKTIELAGHGIQREAAAIDAITPGMLIERAPGGVQTHTVAGGVAGPTFAVESGMTGGTIDTDYEIGENVFFKTFAQGSAVYALLINGAGQVTAEGTKLSSNGDGCLKVAAATEVVVAEALEVLDNDPGTGPARLRVEVLTAYKLA